ncbi:MAG TPA: phosphotransferase, partial [Mycobacteriales bacterium]|nr:phosphotransferase [Mycobacteriales bacterium]
MAVSFFDFFVSSTLANPEISLERARDIVRDGYGRDGELTLLGSQQDYNVRVDVAGDTVGRTVLKIANSAFHVRELEAQNAAMSWVAGRVSDMTLPVVVPALDGTEISTLDIAGESCAVRMVTYVEGEVLAAAPYLSPAALTGLGDLVAAVSAALADFDHDGLDRTLQWDLRQASRVVELLLPHVGDPARAEALTAAVARSETVLEGVTPLPVQPSHGDLTEDNVVGRYDDAGRIVPGGVIDFGDLARSWRVGDLAVACASLLYRSDTDPMAVLPVIRGFDARLPLTDPEIDALWPLVVERAAVLVVSGQQQVSISPDNEYAERSQDRDWSIFECATSVPLPAMSAALRHALGRPPAPRPDRAAAHRLLPSLDPARLVPIDLSPTSASLDAGRWLDDDAEETVGRQAVMQSGAVAMTRYGECRLTRSRPELAAPSSTCALHVEVRLPAGQAVVAPFDGELRRLPDGRVLLTGERMSLLLGGVGLRPGKPSVVAGQEIGSAGPGPLRIQLCSVAG